jgi:hypothetical protein
LQIRTGETLKYHLFRVQSRIKRAYTRYPHKGLLLKLKL